MRADREPASYAGNESSDSGSSRRGSARPIFRSSGWSPITAAILPARICLSTLACWRRHGRPALASGAYRSHVANGDLLAYMREAEGDRLLVVLNFGPGQVSVALPSGGCKGTVLVSSIASRDGENLVDSVVLSAYEGAVIALDR